MTDKEDRNKVDRTIDEWKSILSEEEFRVLRNAGTEPPFSGEFNAHFKDGTYSCKGCGTPLFESNSKFDSHCGWPSFDAEIEKGTIKEVVDRSHGMIRTEIRCGVCDSHLGHVFPDGPTPTGTRYCVNSVCLTFDEKGE